MFFFSSTAVSLNFFFFFSSRRRHTRFDCDWSSDVCSSDLLQASLLVPLHRAAQAGARALPIRFEEVSRVKKPGRKAKPEDWQAYKLATKLHNLSQRFVEMMGHLRQSLDAAGGNQKLLVLAGDGSFCNRTCFRATRDRTELIARARKDAVLCFHAPPDSRRFYATDKFTPEQVRQDESRAWKETKLF